VDPETHAQYRNKAFLKRAVMRYEKFFQLCDEDHKAGRDLLRLVPTRDISLVWCSHMQHPREYRVARQILPGRITTQLVFTPKYTPTRAIAAWGE
jgi:hypothetical protein